MDEGIVLTGLIGFSQALPRSLEKMSFPQGNAPRMASIPKFPDLKAILLPAFPVLPVAVMELLFLAKSS